MKTCFRCNSTLPLSGFYRHAMMADGHLNKCKECTKADTAKREALLMANPETRRKERERHRVKSARARALGLVRKETPVERRVRLRLDEERHPERYAARRAAGSAVKRGILVRKPCEVCGLQKVDGHHPDYSQPLNVMWLCRKHHMELHRKDQPCPTLKH